MKLNKDKCKVLPLGLTGTIWTRAHWLGSVSAGEDGGSWGAGAKQEPRVRPGSCEGQWHPGLRQQEHGEWIIGQWLGRGYSPLLGSCLPACGTRCPLWGSPVEQSWYRKLLTNWSEFSWEHQDGCGLEHLLCEEAVGSRAASARRRGSPPALTKRLPRGQSWDFYTSAQWEERNWS